jgi:two-component system, OmpR family, response regulator
MKKNIRILLCEDDPNLGSLLSEYLNAKGYETALAKDGVEGMKVFKRQHFDFLILDVMMPNKDGFTLASEIREENRHIPILFLTAKSMKEDTLKGFKVGADDYMTKPFSFEELQVRINAILRRAAALPDEGEQVDDYQIGMYSFDYNKQRLFLNGDETKYGLLERNYALHEIWGDDNYFNGRSMDVYIAKLRKHLKADEKVEIINVHGRGFKLLDQ